MDDNSGKTKYSTVTQDMLDAFSALSYYSPLPGERELSDLFGVSRPTVRKALQVLEDERKVIRIRGRGSFYIGNKKYMVRGKDSEIGFTDDMVSRSKYTKSKVINQNVIPVAADIAERLGISEGEDVFHLQHLLTMDEDFVSLASAYIPFNICPALIRYDFTTKSLYDSLRENEIFPHQINKIFTTVPCGEYQARYLGTLVGEPLSYMQTLAYDKNGQVIEYSYSYSLAYKTCHEMISYVANEDKVDERNESKDKK